MTLPEWQQRALESEAETREILRRHSEAESRRLNFNSDVDGDILGLDDGRAGIGYNPTGWLYGSPFTLGLSGHVTYYIIRAVIIVAIIIIGQSLKARYADQLDEPSAAPAGADSAPPGASANPLGR